MKKLLPIALFILTTFSACDGWEYQVPTFPAPPPTITPSIYTPTPVIVTPTNTQELATVSPTVTVVETSSETPTETTIAFTETPPHTHTPTLPPTSPNIIVDVLGCNTSIDISHGMGEVTNAFVTLKNNTGGDFTDVCTTLFALDEGRIHPDKTVCVPALAYGQQVTLKLTADSTYRQNTPIQIEVKSEETLLSRIGQESCTNIGLFAPEPATLLTPIPMQ